MDLVLLGYGAIALATMLNTSLGTSGSVVLAILFGSVWTGYRARKPWAYWPAVAAMSLTFLFFIVLVLLYLWSGLSGDMLNLVLAFLMLWAAIRYGASRPRPFPSHLPSRLRRATCGP